MSQTIYIPKISVVLICGASCTGKSTLAQKIIDACPAESKVLLSADQILDMFLRRHPEAVNKVLKSIAVNNGTVVHAEFQDFLSRVFSEALLCSHLVVSEGIYVRPNMIVSQIMATSYVRGPISPFILIKMNPSEKQHQKFYDQRSKDRKLARPIIDEEVQLFQEVLRTDYSGSYPWVQQYTIDDPCTANVQFLD